MPANRNKLPSKVVSFITILSFIFSTITPALSYPATLRSMQIGQKPDEVTKLTGELGKPDEDLGGQSVNYANLRAKAIPLTTAFIDTLAERNWNGAVEFDPTLQKPGIKQPNASNLANFARSGFKAVLEKGVLYIFGDQQQMGGVAADGSGGARKNVESKIIALANFAQSLPEEGYVADSDTYLASPYQTYIDEIMGNREVFTSITPDDIAALKMAIISLSDEISCNEKVKWAINLCGQLIYEIARHPDTLPDMAEAAYLTLEKITQNLAEQKSLLTLTNVITLSACANYISKLTNNIETCQYVTSSTPFILREAVFKLLICDFDEAGPAISYNLTALEGIAQNNQFFADNAISSLEDIIEHTIKDKVVIYKPHLIRIVTDYVIVFYHSGRKTKIYDYITLRTINRLRMVRDYLSKDKNFPEGKTLLWKCDLAISWCKMALGRLNPKKTLLANATAPTENIPFEDSLHGPGTADSEGPSIVKAEALELNQKNPYYSKNSVKESWGGYIRRFGKVNIRTPQEADEFGKWLFETKKVTTDPDVENYEQYKKRQQVTVNGRKLSIITEFGIGISRDELVQVIEEAIRRSEGDVNNLPDTIVVAILDGSSHLFEDHLANGFIGINRSVLAEQSITNNHDLQTIILKVGLFHEFCHEATKGQGDLFEKVQLIRDTQYAYELMQEENERIPEPNKKITSDTLRLALKDILQDYRFVNHVRFAQENKLPSIRSILEQAEIDRTNKLIEELKIITTRTLVEPKKIVIQRIEDNSRILREIVQSPNVSEQTFKVLIPALLDTITNAGNKKPSDERRSVVHQCALILLEISKNPLAGKVIKREDISRIRDEFYSLARQERPKLITIRGVPVNRKRVDSRNETIESTLLFYSGILRNVAISDTTAKPIASEADTALKQLRDNLGYISPAEGQLQDIAGSPGPINYARIALGHCQSALEFINRYQAEQQENKKQENKKVEQALAKIKELSSGTYFAAQNVLHKSLNIPGIFEMGDESYGLIFSGQAVFENGLGVMLPNLARNLFKMGQGRVVVVVNKGNQNYEAQIKIIKAMNEKMEFGSAILIVDNIEDGIADLNTRLGPTSSITYITTKGDERKIIEGINSIIVVDKIIEALHENNPENITDILEQFKQAYQVLEKV